MAAAAAVGGNPDSWEVRIDGAKAELEQNPGREAGSWINLSIYRVPMYICGRTGTAFRPQVVSLGPYHHGRRPLSLMEEAKHRAFAHLLRETDKRASDYLEALRGCLDEAMDAYEQLDPRWRNNTEEFLQMMVLDGCFVIEILRKNFTKYFPSDPVFSQGRQPTIIEYLRRDMLLLENQLPLVVLKRLDDMVAAATGSTSNLNSLLLKFCFPDNKQVTYRGGGKHMLDVALQSMLQNLDNAPQEQTGSSPSWKCMAKPHQVWMYMKGCVNESCFADKLQEAMIYADGNELLRKSGAKLSQAWIRLKQITKNSWCPPKKVKEKEERSRKNRRSAKELCQVGIGFQRSKSNGLREIKFTKQDDILHLPTITIDHNSESMFLNFIAFEQLHLSQDRLMTSYFLFMNGLITSAEDVKLLRDCEIIDSSVANDITIARMIEKLTKGLSFSENDELYQTQQDLNDYYTESEKRCKRKAKTWYSNMCETYFASPWTIIKLGAGMSLLGLTIIATIYTILQLYKGRN